MMFPGLHPMAMMSTLGMGTGFPNRGSQGGYGGGPGGNAGGSGGGGGGGMYGGPYAPGGPPNQPQQPQQVRSLHSNVGVPFCLFVSKAQTLSAKNKKSSEKRWNANFGFFYQKLIFD